MSFVVSKYILVLFMGFSAFAAEPPPINTVSRKISQDGAAPAVAAPAPATVAIPKKAKVRRDAGVAKSAAVKKDPGVANTLNIKKDPGVAAKSATGVKNDDVLSVQTAAPAGGATTSGGTTTGTTTGTASGGVLGVSAGKVLAASDSTSAAVTSGVGSNNQDNAQMMQLLATAMAMFGGGAPNNSANQSASDQAQILSTVKQAGEMNDFVSKATTGEFVVDQACEDCARNNAANSDPRFEKCVPGNDYLEPALDNSASADPIPSRNSMTCIAASMRASPISHFVACGGTSGNGDKRNTRPCASARMVKRVAQAFEDTSDCLADFVAPAAASSPDVKQNLRRSMFQLVNHESHFGVNARSGTGATGMGQLTEGAIYSANNLGDFQAAKNHIQNSSNEACKRLASKNFEMMEPKSDCSASSIMNKNPELNFIYTLIHMKQVRFKAAKTVGEMGVQFPTETHKETFLNQMAIWGHNVGAGGVNTALQSTLQTNAGLLTSTNINGDQTKFFAIMSERVAANESGARKNEAGNFYANTMASLNNVTRTLASKAPGSKENPSCGIYGGEP